MKLTRPRFTVRRLMIAVAILAIPLALEVRRRNLFALAERHYAQVRKLSHLSPGLTLLSTEDPQTLYHLNLARKYYDAARRPWLPVAPDPPEPNWPPPRPWEVLPVTPDPPGPK